MWRRMILMPRTVKALVAFGSWGGCEPGAVALVAVQEDSGLVSGFVCCWK